jgi:hypothetical protein
MNEHFKINAAVILKRDVLNQIDCLVSQLRNADLFGKDVETKQIVEVILCMSVCDRGAVKPLDEEGYHGRIVLQEIDKLFMTFFEVAVERYIEEV